MIRGLMESVFPQIGPKNRPLVGLRSTGTQGSAKLPRHRRDIAESIRERSGIATGTAFSSPAALPGEGSGTLALPAGPHLPCRSQDRAHDPLVPGTAAEIAADCDPHGGRACLTVHLP